MKKPTVEQVQAELKALKELRDKIPPLSGFGANNLDKIDAEIDVLEHNLTNAQIQARYGIDETAEEYDGEIDPAQEAAEYARQWLDGEATDGAMSDSWRPLAGKQVKPIRRGRP